MRAVVYRETGPSSVLSLVDRGLPEPGPGEVRVRLVRAGVNPTDWKRRQNPLEFPEVTPGQDGAGVVDAVGPGAETSIAHWPGGRRCRTSSAPSSSGFASTASE